VNRVDRYSNGLDVMNSSDHLLKDVTLCGKQCHIVLNNQYYVCKTGRSFSHTGDGNKDTKRTH
jgi:bacillopeptidase F (M6 metalloprotease family)